MSKNKTKAFTLIETMVALVISMLAIGAMYFAYQYFNNSYQSITDRAAMSEAGRNSLSIIKKVSHLVHQHHQQVLYNLSIHDY